MGRLRKAAIAILTVVIIIMAAVCVIGFLKTERAEETIPPTTVEPTAETEPPVTLPETQATEPMEVEYDTVPQYLQTDYPYIKYGNGTIGTSGCSITSLAMVATYLTDHEYTPDELAYHFGSYGKNNIERLEYGAQMLQLPNEKNFDWQITKKALQEGKVAIVMVNERSLFTTSQHFIVLTGITEKGRVLVNDPYGPNYENPYMAERFEKGFTEGDITAGLCGCWVFDKESMPEEPFLYNAEKPVQQENRYTGYELTEEDIYLLACFAWAEAKDEPYEVQQAVLEVVLNRLVMDGFPNTIRGVISANDLYHITSKMQYVDEPGIEQYMAVTSAMYGPYILPMEVVYFTTWNTKDNLWGQIGDYNFYFTREQKQESKTLQPEG